MKLNKTFGRVATTLVAAAMLASLAAPVYAANVTQSDTSAEKTGMTTVSIDKQLVMPKDTSTPTMTFKFAITDGTVGDNDTVSLPVVGGEGEMTTLDVYDGVGASTTTTVGSVAIDSTLERKAWNSSEDKVYVEKELTLTLPAATSFSKAGVYKYDIKETTDFTDTDYIDAMVDTETGKDGLDLYLIVERTNPSAPVSADDEYKITGAFVYPDGMSSNPEGKTADYVNYYKLNSDGEKTVNSLAFTKQIAGAMGDKNDSFTFEVAVPGVADNTVYKYDRTGITANAETDADVVAKDGKLTFNNVGHNETITVKGLDIGTEYTITETNAGTYTVSTDGDDTDTNKDDNIAKLTIAENNKVVSTTFTNTRDAVSPTGLAMDIAPYALLVVVAAAGCFVFLRKRSED